MKLESQKELNFNWAGQEFNAALAFPKGSRIKLPTEPVEIPTFDKVVVAWAGRPLAKIKRLKQFANEVNKAIGDDELTPILFVNCGPGEEERIKLLKESIECNQFPKNVIGVFPNETTPFAVYAYGWLLGAFIGNTVIEIDSQGAQPPDKIPDALRAFAGNDAALGMRATNKFRWQRKMFSWLATQYSNVVLRTDKKDMSSGYEVFDRNLILKLLKIRPPKEWISWKDGLLFLTQNEIRYALNVLEQNGQIKVGTFMFDYGSDEIRGKAFSFKEIFAATKGLYHLWSTRNGTEKDLKRYASSKINLN